MSLRAFYEAVLPAEGAFALFLGTSKRHIWAESLDELTAATERRIEREEQGLYFATGAFATPTNRTAANLQGRRAFCLDIDAGAAKFAKHGDKVYASQRDALAAVTQWVKDSRLTPRFIVSSGQGLHVYFTVPETLTLDEWQPLASALKNRIAADGLKQDAGITGDAVRVLRPPGSLHSSGAPVRILWEGRDTSLAAIRRAVDGFVEAPRRSRGINDDVLQPPAGPPKSVLKVIKHCAAMAHAARSRGDIPEPYWRAMLGIVKFTTEGLDAAHELSRGHPDYDERQTEDKFNRWTAGPTTCETFGAENPEACAGCKFRGQVRSPIMLGELTVEELASQPAPAPAEPAEVPEPQEAQENAPAADPDPFGGAFGSDSGSDGEEDDEPPAPRAAGDMEWDKYMPESFRVAKAGSGYLMIQRRVVMEPSPTGEGTVRKEVDVAFSSVPFWFDSWAAGSNDADQAAAVYRVYDAGTKRTTSFTMPTRVVAKRDTLLTTLASQNIQVHNPANPNLAKAAMEDYVKASLERIRNAGQKPKVTDRFGTFYDHNGELIVAQGALLMHKDGLIQEGVVQEKLRQRAAAYTINLQPSISGVWQKGDWFADTRTRAEQHIEYLREFYSDPNFSPYQLAIMLAWASPLLAFMQGTFHPNSPLPGAGLTVSLFSVKSGIGKTAAMHAAALAFGVPNAIVMQLDRTNSTENARQGLLLQSGTMPAFMDEMENLDPTEIASLVSAVGNGASKLRMTKETALTGGVTTALINIMSTNKSHRELVAADRTESTAVQMRLLEIDCSGVQPVSPERASAESATRSKLHVCAGAVGALIHWAMCAAGGEVLNKAGIECADKARELVGGQQDGRFMWRAFGAVLLMRRLLKSLGFKVFELETLTEEFKRWHDVNYEFTKQSILPSDGVALFNMFLADIDSKTLVTMDESQRHGGAETKVDVPLNDHMPQTVVARSVVKHRHMYIRTDALKDWCHKRRVSHVSLLNKCKAAGVFEYRDPADPSTMTRQIDLYKGTKLAQGVRSTVFKVRLDKLGWDEVRPGGNVVELRRAEPGDAPEAAAPTGTT